MSGWWLLLPAWLVVAVLVGRWFHRWMAEEFDDECWTCVILATLFFSTAGLPILLIDLLLGPSTRRWMERGGFGGKRP